MLATIWIFLDVYKLLFWQWCSVLNLHQRHGISDITYSFGACGLKKKTFQSRVHVGNGGSAPPLTKWMEGGKSDAHTTTSSTQTGFLTKTVARRWLMAGMWPDQMRHPCVPPQPMVCPRTGVVAPDEPVEHLSRHTPPVASWLRFVAQLLKSQNNWSKLQRANLIYLLPRRWLWLCDCVANPTS